MKNEYYTSSQKMISPLLGTLMLACVVFAQSPPDVSLLAVARTALPLSISTDEIRKAIDTGLWNSSRTAAAICFNKAKIPTAWVFIKQSSGRFLAVDVSKDGLALGRIGLSPRSAYERLELTPVKWVDRDDGVLYIFVRTRAWKGGQRYTVSKPLLILQDGTILQQ